MILQAIPVFSQTDLLVVFSGVATILLSVCVYFLKRFVDSQDSLVKLVGQLTIDIAVIKTNGETMKGEVEDIRSDVDEIKKSVIIHETKLQVIEGKLR